MFRALATLILISFLSGCVAQLPWASDEKITRAAYHDRGAPSITLITVVANDTNSAGHSALLINASQRVLYDPAGTWWNRAVPERADLLYGMTPKMVQYYYDYHARKRFRVIVQKKIVSRAVAEAAMQLAIKRGASVSGFCASNTSHILSETSGFEGFPVSIWPKNAIAAMAKIKSVTTREIRQNDEGKDLHSS